MTVAIVHYHLGPGGVTKVIAAASRALTKSKIRHVILVGSGSDDDGPNDLPVRIVPEIGYLTAPTEITPEELLNGLRAAAREALGAAPDVWHFHNHSLGKNPLIPEVIASLAEANERIVLQIHDLAEDGRPANYQAIADCAKLYPVSDRVHYAFLNSRDLQVFIAAGLPAENASLLPNPISKPPGGQRALAEGPPPSPILFAPARGIRRKNLGELAFLSALAPAGTRFAVSRAPTNPDALAIYNTWQHFARYQSLPIAFDVVDHFAPDAGASSDFESWINHATHIITTSVSEGFGLPFLEAAALGKPLLGRNLPHITADHASHGIHSGNLYDQLLIPLEWVDLTILNDHLNTTLERNYRAYQRPLPQKTIDATLAAIVNDGWLDFGNLPEPLQQGAIERLADPHCRKIPRVVIHAETRIAQDWLAAAIANRKPTVTSRRLAPYSPSAYQKNLVSLYKNLTSRKPSPVGFLTPSTILNAHLTPELFHFLLSALPPKPKPWSSYRAVIFDIYGTLLIAPACGIKPDPAADPLLRGVLEEFGYEPPESPSTALHHAMLRHHAAAGIPFPEVDLRILWREVLALEPGTDTNPLVEAIESAWHPTRPMPGAAEFIQNLSRTGISLGLLSNAQCNTLPSLGDIKDLFAPELTILSFHHRIAKPSPVLFEMLTDRLAGRGISPADTLYIGNDPLQDITPAAACGFKTALFTGHPDSIRPGECLPDHEFKHWPGSSAFH